MADCNSSFKSFYQKIDLTDKRKKDLAEVRDAVRKKIENYFKSELKVSLPTFRQQGSFPIRTAINPLDGEYDIDYGIYLTHLDENDKSEWPKTKDVHGWIMKALDGHTKDGTKDKNNCVRLNYVGNYHIDLPIYSKYLGKKLIARLGEDQWSSSDTKLFEDWFYKNLKDKEDQLRLGIKYFKAWKDNKKVNVPGIVLTILFVEQFVSEKDRDDISLINTASSILNRLKVTRSVLMPVDPFDNPTTNWSDSRWTNFISSLEILVSKGSKAIDEEDSKKSTLLWQNLFGDRFNVTSENAESNSENGENDIAEKSVTVIQASRPWYNE